MILACYGFYEVRQEIIKLSKNIYILSFGIE